MPDFHTVSGPIAMSIDSGLSSLGWREGEMDGQPLLEADVGQLALTVYTDAEPPRSQGAASKTTIVSGATHAVMPIPVNRRPGGVHDTEHNNTVALADYLAAH